MQLLIRLDDLKPIGADDVEAAVVLVGAEAVVGVLGEEDGWVALLYMECCRATASRTQQFAFRNKPIHNTILDMALAQLIEFNAEQYASCKL